MLSRTLRAGLVAGTLVVALSLGGCLTLDPTVEGSIDGSAVFEDVSATERWAGAGVRVRMSLRSTAEAGNVTTISVVRADGQTHQTVSVDPGQRTVVLALPANQQVTVVAYDGVAGRTIETRTITASGDRVP